MASPERRTPERIREEIRTERAQLDAQFTALGADVKRTGRIAGSALAALGSVILLVRLRGRRRG